MVVIHRLLTYTFPDKDAAFKSLLNRGVKGSQEWGRCKIVEAFYYDSNDAKKVLEEVLPLTKRGAPPAGAKEVPDDRAGNA